MEENVFFFIVESKLLYNMFFSFKFKNEMIFPNFVKKKEIFWKSLESRLFEKVFSFFVSIFSEKGPDKIFVIFHDNFTKWVLPFSGKKLTKKKEKFWNILKNYLIQEIKILKIDLSENFKRKNKFFFDFTTSLDFIYYFTKNFSIKKTGFRIMYFISQTLPEENSFPLKYILFARKKKIVFDIFLFSKKDSYYLHYLSEKTGGIYCRQKKNLLEILYTEEIYNILCSIFLPSYFSKQFCILPFSTKQTRNSQLFRKKISCPLCMSIFNYFFSECLVCGIKFLN